MIVFVGVIVFEGVIVAVIVGVIVCVGVRVLVGVIVILGVTVLVGVLVGVTSGAILTIDEPVIIKLLLSTTFIIYSRLLSIGFGKSNVNVVPVIVSI